MDRRWSHSVVHGSRPGAARCSTMPAMSSAALVSAFNGGEIEIATSTEHYSYSTVETTTHTGCVLGLVRSIEPIKFAQMGDYFGQRDALEAFLDRFEVERAPDTPEIWLHYNEADQPTDPGGNPVREPFYFQVACVVSSKSYPGFDKSPTVGEFAVAQLRALRVARVIYKGSSPHQQNSGFAEASMTLMKQADELGYRPKRTLYRELYHYIDSDDPTQSITQIEIEIER